ncbi:MAG: hypothetical protein B7Z55_08665, partial [Planctomycetales bacterium 12-60-4]
AEKLLVFQAHFLHEQDHVVGPAIAQAVDAFDWPVVKAIALRPIIRFAYFGRHEWFSFGNFSIKDERIEKGLRAFAIGARIGWSRVEQALAEYRVLPEAFFADAVGYFGSLRAALLQHA